MKTAIIIRNKATKVALFLIIAKSHEYFAAYNIFHCSDTGPY